MNFLANNASLYNYITGNYYQQLFDKLADYVESNLHSLELLNRRGDNVCGVELYDIAIRRINISNDLGNAIKFDLLVVAELTINTYSRGANESYPVEQWFRISCGAELCNGFKNFRVNSIDIYSKHTTRVSECLSDCLVPIIAGAELDNIAGKFLHHYYPQALAAAMALPVEQVATNMGLHILQLPINKYKSVFGQTHFADTVISYYDYECATYKTLAIKKGTILVDPDVYFLRNVGSYNNTVIHECVHWYLHRKFFELDSLYNKQSRLISCRVDEGSSSDKHRTSYDWMEWQANALAPRILMPYAQAKSKAAEFFSRNAQTCSGTDIIVETIVDMAEFFQVSKMAAKIRMLDLGYREAAGVFNYVNDAYAPPYAFKHTGLSDKQTFVIDLQSLLSLYATNTDFRKQLATGSYIYLDSVVCINNPKYVTVNADGCWQLTSYALQNMHECCLVFDTKTKPNSQYSPDTYREKILFRSAKSSQEQALDYTDNEHNQQVQARAAQFYQEVQADASFSKELTADFADTLKRHIKRVGYTSEGLAEASLLDVKTIQNMRTGKNVKLESLMAVCIALHLKPMYSKDLLNKAGYYLNFANETQCAYQALLDTYYLLSVRECNILLSALGIPPLVQDK